MTPLLLALVEAGILPRDDAERIHRTLDPEQARLQAERTLAESFQRGLSAQQRRILDVLDDTQGQPTARQMARRWGDEDALLYASVQDDLISVATEHAIRASINTANPDMWMLVNEEVSSWVQTHYTSPDAGAFGSIPNLNATSRSQFAAEFERWQRGDRTPGNYADGLPQLINELTPVFGPVRAERIAVTEVTRVFAESERAAARANPFVEYFQYLASADERICPVCMPAANTVTPKGSSTFPDGLGFPPRHVRCRCSVTQLTGPALDALREEGLVRDGAGARTGAVRESVLSRGDQSGAPPSAASTKGGTGSVQAKDIALLEGEKIIRDEEKKIYIQLRENALVARDDGTVVLKKKGSATQIGFTDKEIRKMKDARFTHNHPNGWSFNSSDPRRVGNSFSPEDIELASFAQMREIRAVTPRYIYSMKPPPGGWNEDFWNNTLRSEVARVDEELTGELHAAIKNRTASMREMEASHYHELWTRVSEKHGLDYSRVEHDYGNR